MRVRGKNLVVTKKVTFQSTSSGRTYQLDRVEGSYYTSPLSVKSGRACFHASSFRKSKRAIALL